MESFDTNNLKNEYGLSCVEDYILYILALKNDYWPQIFYESTLSFNRIMELILQGQTYSYFSGVPRLQRTSEKLGLLKLKKYADDYFSLSHITDRIFTMQVSSMFMKNKFGTTPWREDHYVLCRYIDDNMFEYINDIPQGVGKATAIEMKEMYNGKIIVIEICENFHCDFKKLLKQFEKKVISDSDIKEYRKDGISFEKLRDAIGITKVMVKRMDAFVNMLGLPFTADKYYSFLCNYYFKVEYMRVRRYENKEAVKIIEEIEQEDRNFRRTLIELIYRYKEKELEE